MKTLGKTFIAVLLVAIGACSDDSTGPTTQQSGPPDLKHVWVASRAEFTKMGQPGIMTEIVAEGGTVTLDLTNSTRFEWTISAGSWEVTHYGMWTATASQLRLNTVDGVVTFTISMSASTLNLSGGRTEFDFGDGNFVAATANLVLARQ